MDATGRWAMISRDDKQPKVFVHVDAVRAIGLRALEKGQRFRFELEQDSRGRAVAADLELLPD